MSTEKIKQIYVKSTSHLSKTLPSMPSMLASQQRNLEFTVKNIDNQLNQLNVINFG